MSKKIKCTAIEKENRLFMVQGWIIEGIQDRLIVKQIMERWSLDVRQAQRYVRDAYDSWKKIEGVNLDMKRELKIAELKQIKRSLKDAYKGTPSGISAIMAVEKEIIKLEGIELPKTVKLELPEVDAIEFNVVYGKSKD
ncbi:hypothetical protein [Flavobacterium sp.]|uniref:hypothetical protein n=1 Tax=Flavobacterium sp. TaxID=239 RepID=UPI0025C372BE|nr:hypothetical protein [Flavobacterium sp.]MBA4155065.1 hypothetical protein [Flavobacterium sp.]